MDLSRRELLKVSGLGLATAGVLAQSQRLVVADDARSEQAESIDPVQRLVEGNARFVAGKTRHAHTSADWRNHLAAGQEPFATILGCSDSRVPPELVFDQGLGDLFVIRVAGNVIAADVLGSLQYAILHLKTPLLVVLGHERCGAVTAAVEYMVSGMTEPSRISDLVDRIVPGLKSLDLKMPVAERVSAAVRLNTIWTAEQIEQLPERTMGTAATHPRLVSAIYDVATGKVNMIENK